MDQDGIEIKERKKGPTVGGSAWEIYSILEDLSQYSLTAIVSKIKREKVAIIADRTFDDEARNCLLRHFRKQPTVSETQLDLLCLRPYKLGENFSAG